MRTLATIAALGAVMGGYFAALHWVTRSSAPAGATRIGAKGRSDTHETHPQDKQE